MKVSALQSQQSMRDLSALSNFFDDIQWLDEKSLAKSENPAVLVGTWLFEAPGEAKRLLSARCDLGAATIVVPRWKSGNVGQILGAPTKVDLEFGEYDDFTFDNETIQLPGQSIIKSSLHSGRWGETSGGAAILAYRPSEGAGAVVLCTAALCSQRFGVDVNVQRELLTDLIERGTSTHGVKNSTESVEKAIAAPVSLAEFLAEGAQNAAIMLASVISEGETDADQVTKLLTTLGMEIPNKQLERSLQQLSAIEDSSTEKMETALKEYGWSAYLRLARQRFPRRDETLSKINQPETLAETTTQGEAIER